MSRFVRCDVCGKEIGRLEGEAENIPPYWIRVILTWSDSERWSDLCSLACLRKFAIEHDKRQT